MRATMTTAALPGFWFHEPGSANGAEPEGGSSLLTMGGKSVVFADWIPSLGSRSSRGGIALPDKQPLPAERTAMSTPEVRDGKPPHRIRISTRAAFILGLFIVPVVYTLMVGVLPWVLSLLAPRYGWTESGPATWNRIGLIPVVAGVVGLVWVFSVMVAQFPKRVRSQKAATECTELG